MRFLLLVAANLLAFAWPLAGAAQTTPVLPRRFYAGLSATAANYKLPDYLMPMTFSPSLTVGTQLSHRLALQVSVADYKYRNAYIYDFAGSMPLSVSQTTTTSLHVLAFPVLLRFQATTSTKERYKLDFFSGLTVAGTTSNVDYVKVDVATQAILAKKNTQRASTEVYLPIGVCVHVNLVPDLDLATEVAVQVPLSYTRTNSLGFNDAFFTTASLGVHYHLGARLP